MTRAEMIDEICDHMNWVRNKSNHLLLVVDMSLVEMEKAETSDAQIAATLSAFRELSKNLKACVEEEKNAA